MSNVKNVAKNSSILAFGSLTNRALDFVSIALLSQYLSKDAFGAFSSIMGFILVVGAFGDFGMIYILRRECAKDREHFEQYINNGLTLGLIAAAAVIAVGFIIVQLSNYPLTTKQLFNYGFLGLLVSGRYFSFRKLIEVMFLIDFRAHYIAILNFLERILFLVFIFFIIARNSSSVEAVFWGVVAESAGFVLLTLFYIRKYNVPKLVFEKDKWKFLYQESWPILLSNVAIITISKINIPILTSMRSSEDVAIFNVGSKIPLIISFIPVAFAEPISVILSKKFTVNKDVFFSVYKTMIKYLMLIAFPLVVLIFVEAEEIIVFFFSESYTDSAYLARVLVISEILTWGFFGFSMGLISSNNQKNNFKILLVSAFGAVLLNIFLIKSNGVAGAAYATLISSGLFIIVAFFIGSVRNYVLAILTSLLKPGLTALLMGIVIYYIDVNMWFSSMLSPVVYLIFFIIIKGFGQRDIEFLQELFPKNKFVNNLNTNSGD